MYFDDTFAPMDVFGGPLFDGKDTVRDIDLNLANWLFFTRDRNLRC